MLSDSVKLSKWFSSRLFWSTLSSLSSALSTLIYLYLIYQKPFANEFIYRYGFVGMWSGWANNFIYFLPINITTRELRRVGVIAFFISLLICVSGPSLLYKIPLQLSSSAFIATLLMPILVAGIYGEQMRRANYVAAYLRNVIWNLALFALAIFSLFFSNANINNLYIITFLAVPLALFAWLVDPFFFALGEVSRKSAAYRFSWLRVFFNPALLLLLRLIFDQKVLEIYEISEYTFSFYTLSRIFSLMGSVLFSLLVSHSLGRNDSPKYWHLLWLITFCISSLLLFCLPMINVNGTLIWGQWVTWLVSASLLLFLEKKNNLFELFSVLWITDLAVRYFAVRTVGVIEFKLISTALTALICLVFSITFYRLRLRPIRQQENKA